MHDELNLSKNIRSVIDYHERTKHHPDRFAASLGYMDWANQPGPFRTYADSEPIDLPFPALRQAPLYDDLFSQTIKAGSIDADFIGRLFYHSLALSAWKKAPNTPPWSLRINPSSGDLHPTEGYMVSGKIPELIDSPGVFHYAPYNHCLECRCRLSAKQWRLLTANLPAPCLLIGLTSIYWRESWKYGERAFRYCHHDVGHAIGAVAVSARTLGWKARLLESISDEGLDRLLKRTTPSTEAWVAATLPSTPAAECSTLLPVIPTGRRIRSVTKSSQLRPLTTSITSPAMR